MKNKNKKAEEIFRLFYLSNKLFVVHLHRKINPQSPSGGIGRRDGLKNR